MEGQVSQKATLRDVRSYWEKHPAGYDELKHLEGDPLAFLEERDRRTRLASPHIHEKYRMHLVRGLDVLDIGCGQGYNAQELVRSGGRLTAIDLTAKGLSLATQRFRLRGFHANFVQADAENLPFKNESFDFVHSSGAIHHTPHIEKAVDEIYRVLKKGGRGSIMVYHKSSWVYWYRIHFRLRLLMTLLYLLPPQIRRHLLTRRPQWVKYVPQHWPSNADILNAGTDFGGVENPLSRVFTRREAARLFARFTIEGFATSWGVYKPFQERKNLFDRVASTIHGWIGERWGWYLFVYIRK